MRKRGKEPRVVSEPLGIVISRGGESEPVESPAAWAFVWGPAELDEATLVALAA
jgi:hypothetical protein